MSLIQTFNDWITLADAHELLGTDSPAKDVEVQGMIDAIDAMITSYLGRNLKHCEHSETTFRPEGSFLSLNNWPLISFTSITVDGSSVAEDNFDIDMGLGMMYWLLTSPVFSSDQPANVVVQYIAGYETLPPELVVMFNTLLTARYAVGGSAESTSTGEIKKVSLVGVAAVEFDTGGSAVAYSGVDRLTGVPEELKPYVGLLDKYRSDFTMGIV